jgi:pyridinium-3,5-biscarboxylic acid mononucleotide sulfurtransferase
MEIYDKLNSLKKHIETLGSMVVAYSGGVDSTFLLKVAHDVLHEQVIAVTATSSTYPERECREAVDFAKKAGIPQMFVHSEELDIEGFSDNSVNRCYLCKTELFSKIKAIADQKGMKYVAEGSNLDDLGDYRPGMRAIKELGIVSPLKEAGLTKDDIRRLSKDMGLPTWDKPAFACLSSRIPYGHRITREKLQMVDKAEQYLMDLGFRQVRVRHHGDIARIEISPSDRSRFMDAHLMDKVYEKFKELGFAYTALDLKGYRTGSMNEVIDVKNERRFING